MVPVCSSTILHQPPAAPCASSFVAIFGLYSSALTDFFVAMNVTISSRVADGRLPGMKQDGATATTGECDGKRRDGVRLTSRFEG